MTADYSGGNVGALSDTVFLFDVDNTLLDNDRVEQDLRHHLESEFGPATRDRYFAIFEELRSELGYADYLGALQRYRLDDLCDSRLLTMSSFLVDYPFADRLISRRTRSPRARPRLGDNGHPVRRRRGLSAA